METLPRGKAVCYFIAFFTRLAADFQSSSWAGAQAHSVAALSRAKRARGDNKQTKRKRQANHANAMRSEPTDRDKLSKIRLHGATS
jgi:hypothetical protein